MRYRIRKAARALALAAITTGLATAAQAGLEVDRGLPDSNLNNTAGSDRSNVAWGFGGDFMSGDDFTLGNGNWAIDTLRMWIIAGSPPDGATPGDELGDTFDNLSLFLGSGSGSGDQIAKVSSTNLTGNASDNPNVSVSRVTYPGSTENYQGSSGSFINIWQLDFNNLGTFTGGKLIFAIAGGLAPQSPDTTPVTFAHASNEALSGTPQDGADGEYFWLSGNAQGAFATVGGSFDSDGNGWDKSSDINVQVFATQVPLPATALLMALGLACGGILRHRRRDS